MKRRDLMNRTEESAYDIIMSRFKYVCVKCIRQALVHVHQGPCFNKTRVSILTKTSLQTRRSYCTNVQDTELIYANACDRTLDCLAESLEDSLESTESPELDITLSDGVLTLKLGGNLGTYVINKQAPNRQIWLSSPVSGPRRFDLTDGEWVCRRDGVPLHVILSEELKQLTGIHVRLEHCSDPLSASS